MPTFLMCFLPIAALHAVPSILRRIVHIIAKGANPRWHFPNILVGAWTAEKAGG